MVYSFPSFLLCPPLTLWMQLPSVFLTAPMWGSGSFGALTLVPSSMASDMWPSDSESSQWWVKQPKGSCLGGRSGTLVADKLLNPPAQERSRSRHSMSPPVGVTAPQGRRAHQMQRQLTLGWNLVDTFRDMVKYSMDFCPSKCYWQKQSPLHNFCLGKYLSLRKKN